MKNAIEYKGIYFDVHFASPSARKRSDSPCRALITPLDPESGGKITKRQLYDKDSDQPVNKVLYGRTPQDIMKRLFPQAADELIFQMHQRGILSDSSRNSNTQHDLAALAREFKEMFFSMHEREWSSRTSAEYQRQYDVLAEELCGIPIEKLTQSAYVSLQEEICRNALKTARKKSDWEMGDQAPASAQKRMNLLYLLVLDLKSVEGCAIPAFPTRYAGKPSRQELLVNRIDNARSIPRDELCNLCSTASWSDGASILADAGLRISEYTGLLFCSLESLDGSQGTMYYIRITGQLDADGKRTEIPKTDLSYRTVPLSTELGLALAHRQQKLEAVYGDVSLLLMFGRQVRKSYCTDPNTMDTYRNDLAECISERLRQPQIVKALQENRAYQFNEVFQNRQLLSMLTCHALRRNFCTWLYCESGLNTEEIYRQMGHADKSSKRRTLPRGATPQELYRLCLKKHVTPTLYHPARPLCYHTDGQINRTEVPACTIELILPPHSKIELTLEDTEPQNTFNLNGTDLTPKLVRKDVCSPPASRYALLASEYTYSIREKRKLFR